MNPTLILFGILGFVAGFAMSLGPVMWVLFSELFPNRVRGIAISFVGLALGVLALVVTLALLEGFQSTIRTDLAAAGAHVTVLPTEGRSLPDPDGIERAIVDAVPGAEVVRRVRGVVLAASPYDSGPVTVVGSSGRRSVGIDRVASARLVAGTGEELELTSSRRRLTPLGPVPVRIRVEIEPAFYHKNFLYKGQNSFNGKIIEKGCFF